MPATKNIPQNRLVDVLEMPDGKIATIESGRAYLNFWQRSGFDGQGYLVCIDGEEVAQTAFRFDALLAVSTGRPITPHTEKALAAAQAKAGRS